MRVFVACLDAIVSCRDVCRFTAGAILTVKRRRDDFVANIPHDDQPLLVRSEVEVDECARFQSVITPGPLAGRTGYCFLSRFCA
ncbi:unnamed protein product [Strongylus vulgaris]|uniref:Uncharacterized protein n=1 Tax=Strongylus vulgaris TaxID=40348 RepID=A0A3P7IQR8_STRVU|nr:unnamed protein product [Strongylus vulgaris]